MDAAALALFKKGFDNNAIIWIWGCAFARAFNIILATLFKTSRFRKTPPNKIKSTDQFDLSFVEDLSKTDGSYQFSWIQSFLPGGVLKPGPPKSYKVREAFFALVDFFKHWLYVTYAAKIAAATGIKTFGALLGTYSSPEVAASKPLWVIPTRKPPYSDNFSQTLNFYKRYVGQKIDPENRGYGTF